METENNTYCNKLFNRNKIVSLLLPTQNYLDVFGINTHKIICTDATETIIQMDNFIPYFIIFIFHMNC